MRATVAGMARSYRAAQSIERFGPRVLQLPQVAGMARSHGRGACTD